MNRFFFRKEKLIHGIVLIEGEDVQHISKVLRLNEGDKIILCDGENFEYISEILTVEKTFIKVQVLEKKECDTEPLVEITLFQGIPKGDKMDLIIQKSVEMGIFRIVPVIMKRSIVKIENEKDGKKKQERWQRIAMEAAKQSGRGRIPQVLAPLSFLEALKISEKIDFRILPYEKEEALSIKKSISGVFHSTVAVLVGPEGGFETKEVERAIDSGFDPVTLGKRILRTETAGFVTIACLMYEFNEME